MIVHAMYSNRRCFAYFFCLLLPAGSDLVTPAFAPSMYVHGAVPAEIGVERTVQSIVHWYSQVIYLRCSAIICMYSSGLPRARARAYLLLSSRNISSTILIVIKCLSIRRYMGIYALCAFEIITGYISMLYRHGG